MTMNFRTFKQKIATAFHQDLFTFLIFQTASIIMGLTMIKCLSNIRTEVSTTPTAGNVSVSIIMLLIAILMGKFFSANARGYKKHTQA